MPYVSIISCKTDPRDLSGLLAARSRKGVDGDIRENKRAKGPRGVMPRSRKGLDAIIV